MILPSRLVPLIFGYQLLSFLMASKSQESKSPGLPRITVCGHFNFVITLPQAMALTMENIETSVQMVCLSSDIRKPRNQQIGSDSEHLLFSKLSNSCIYVRVN